MPLLPANALDRILTWNDFSRRTLPAPAPGVFATAAQTAVGLNLGPLRVVAIPGSAPRRFRINTEPSVTVNFDRARSWVAAFLFGWSRAEQDALLGHEQTHYLIGALLAAGVPPAEMSRLALGTRWLDFFRVRLPRGGMLSGAGLEEFLEGEEVKEKSGLTKSQRRQERMRSYQKIRRAEGPSSYARTRHILHNHGVGVETVN